MGQAFWKLFDAFFDNKDCGYATSSLPHPLLDPNPGRDP
jgi:hypothetical protein